MHPTANIWITRDEPPGGPLCAAIEACGLLPLLEPVIERRCTGDAAAELAALSCDDWLVVTSAFAVRCVARDAARIPRVAVVGPGTAEAARAAGMRVELVGRRGGVRELLEVLRGCAGAAIRICYPRSSRALPIDPWPGADVLDAVIYETVPRPFDRSIIDRVDIAALASPSAVEGMGRVNLPLASIGATTSEAIRRLDMTVRAQATRPTFAALAAAIALVTRR